jgi:transcriptional regulator with XRE-family HTH domain
MTPVVSAPTWTRIGHRRLAILRKYLAANLDRLIRDRGLKQVVVAKDLEISKGYLSKILNEHAFPSEDLLEKILFYFDIDPEDLMRKPQSRTPSKAPPDIVRLLHEAGYDVVKKKPQ